MLDGLLYSCAVRKPEGIGERVRELRKELGLSQGELADKLGTNTASVSRIENEQQDPDIAFVIGLADVCQRSPTYILLGRETMAPPVADRQYTEEERHLIELARIALEHGKLTDRLVVAETDSVYQPRAHVLPDDVREATKIIEGLPSERRRTVLELLRAMTDKT